MSRQTSPPPSQTAPPPGGWRPRLQTVLRRLLAWLDDSGRADPPSPSPALPQPEAAAPAHAGPAASASTDLLEAQARLQHFEFVLNTITDPVSVVDEHLVYRLVNDAWCQATGLSRAEVAKAHNLPAYVVFHDATLAEMAREAPQSIDALGGISGVGAKKLEAYGTEILRVLDEHSPG